MFYPKNLNFIIINGQIFWIKNIRIIAILLIDKFLIKLEKIVYILNYDSNLIFFFQFYKNNIVFINKENYIRLMQND